MRLRLLGLIVGLATMSGAVLFATAGPAGANIEFSVTEHETNFEFAVGGAAPSVNPPQSPPGPGDRFIIRNDLLHGGATVGFANIVCTVTFNDNGLCDAVYSITNKGDIHLTALVRGLASEPGPSVFDAVVDGGTFKYRNAHGDVHIVTQPNGDSEDTFNLVTQ